MIEYINFNTNMQSWLLQRLVLQVLIYWYL